MGDIPICVADCKAALGEAPLWVAREQALYWLDIEGRRIFRQKFGSDGWESFETPLRVGSLLPRAKGGFVAGTEKGLAFADPQAGRFDIFADPERDLPGNRFNDGKTDREGRFWAGTMDDKEEQATGALYRIDADLSVDKADGGYEITNGPAFSLDGRTMYHNDSGRRVVYTFDLDRDGNASNRRVFARFEEEDGAPDGMTVDAEGCLWVCLFGGWCVLRFSPEGECIGEVEMPASQPTSCAFGGPGLDRLFIASARKDLDGEALAREPFAGGLFSLMPGVRGVAEVPFAG
jgi:xylono-1,5-lactonase